MMSPAFLGFNKMEHRQRINPTTDDTQSRFF